MIVFHKDGSRKLKPAYCKENCCGQSYLNNISGDSKEPLTAVIKNRHKGSNLSNVMLHFQIWNYTDRRLFVRTITNNQTKDNSLLRDISHHLLHIKTNSSPQIDRQTDT